MIIFTSVENKVKVKLHRRQTHTEGSSGSTSPAVCAQAWCAVLLPLSHVQVRSVLQFEWFGLYFLIIRTVHRHLERPSGAPLQQSGELGASPAVLRREECNSVCSAPSASPQLPRKLKAVTSQSQVRLPPPRGAGSIKYQWINYYPAPVFGMVPAHMLRCFRSKKKSAVNIFNIFISWFKRSHPWFTLMKFWNEFSHVQMKCWGPALPQEKHSHHSL